MIFQSLASSLTAEISRLSPYRQNQTTTPVNTADATQNFLATLKTLTTSAPVETQQPPAKAGGLVSRTESPDTRRLNDASLVRLHL
ncbi:MAG: hypothetical protein FWC58_08330, partial [Desulfobulbus sp.]|nr:hypothetical protein [Desulfobulbus sp.]